MAPMASPSGRRASRIWNGLSTVAFLNLSGRKPHLPPLAKGREKGLLAVRSQRGGNRPLGGNDRAAAPGRRLAAICRRYRPIHVLVDVGHTGGRRGWLRQAIGARDGPFQVAQIKV